MAANEAFASFGAANSQTSKEIGYECGMNTAIVKGTTFRGIGFPNGDDFAINEVVKLSNGVTLTTGVSVDLILTDNGDAPADLGKVVRFGVTVKRLVSGTDNLDMSTGTGTEQTIDVTLAGTSGVLVVGTVAVATANLDSAALGDHIALKIRRIGSHANDTCSGEVIVLRATPYGY